MRIAKAILPLLSILLVVLFSLGYTTARPTKHSASDNWYLLSIEGTPAGYWHAVRRPSSADSDQIHFEHEILTDLDQERVQVNIKTVCDNDPYYYPVKVTATIRKPGKPQATLDVVVEKQVPYGATKGTMFVTYDTGSKQYNLKKEIHEHTVPDYVLIEIMPLLPLQEGPVFKFNLFDIAKLKARKKHKIEYLGQEMLQIAGTSRNLHKFRHKGSGVKETFYWLNDNHQVVRTLRDKKEELLLTTRAEAKRLFP